MVGPEHHAVRADGILEVVPKATAFPPIKPKLLLLSCTEKAVQYPQPFVVIHLAHSAAERRQRTDKMPLHMAQPFPRLLDVRLVG